MAIVVCFSDIEHSFKGRYGWSNKYIVITIAKGASEDAVDLAAIAAVLKEHIEVGAVVAVGKACQNPSLTHMFMMVKLLETSKPQWTLVN